MVIDLKINREATVACIENPDLGLVLLACIIQAVQCTNFEILRGIPAHFELKRFKTG